MSELLSENEIDALMDGVDGETAQGGQASDDDHVLYDLSSGIHRVEGWKPYMEIVDNRIKATLSNKLLGLLHKTVEVKRQEIKILRYGEYSKSLEIPTSINCYALSNLVGLIAIVLDAKIVYALVNAFFGGGSRSSEVEGREFSHTEQRVVALILKTIVDAIKESFREISGYEFLLAETEMNPAHLKSYSDSDVLMVRPFEVEFSGVSGNIDLIMSGTVVDSIFRNKRSKIAQAGITSRDALVESAQDFSLVVSGELESAKLTISEVIGLSEGDIVAIGAPDNVAVKINGVAKLRARMGDMNGRVGLEISSLELHD